MYLAAAQAKDKRIATGVFQALKEDLADTAAAGGHRGQAAQALLHARDTYYRMSKAFQDTNDEILNVAFKLDLKQAPGTFPQKLFSKARFDDEQVSKTMGILHIEKPEVAASVRASALASMLDGVPAEGLPAKLAQADSKLGSRIKALYFGDDAGYATYRKIAEVAKRLAQHPSKGAPEEQLFPNIVRLPWMRLGAVGGGAGALTGFAAGVGSTGIGVAGAAGIAGTAAIYAGLRALSRRLTTNNLTNILARPDSARMLLSLMEPKRGVTAKQIASTVERLLAMTAAMSPQRTAAAAESD